MEEDKEFMIVSRVKSPPYEHKTEILYQGNPIEVSDIPNKLCFTDESRGYFYSIYRIKRSEHGFSILRDGYSYDGSLRKDFVNKGCEFVTVPFNNVSKKGLLNFLESL